MVDIKDKYEKQFKSFKKKLGKHSIWFNALSIKKQWDVLFLWKEYKWNCNNISGFGTISKKCFFNNIKRKYRFRVSKENRRNSALNMLKIN